MPRKKVTVSAIALRAGVSPSTVSLVLNRRGKELRINKATQQRVRDAAKQLNYVPNYLARGLTGASTRSIGLVWPLGGAASNGSIAYELIQRIAHRGYICHMTDHLRDAQFTRRALIDQLQRRVDGLILHAGGDILDDDQVRAVLMELTSVVIITPRAADLQSALPHDVIYHDRSTAMCQIADHLVNTGRCRIGIFSAGHANAIKLAALTNHLGRRRAAPARPVLPAFDVVEERYLLDARTRLDAHYDNSDFPFDAVVCTNDDMAVAMMDFLRTRNLTVPDDVAVIGFDDSPTAPMMHPPLASVTRYDAQVAGAAENAMFGRMANPARQQLRQTIAMTFTPRTSAGALQSKSL